MSYPNIENSDNMQPYNIQDTPKGTNYTILIICFVIIVIQLLIAATNAGITMYKNRQGVAVVVSGLSSTLSSLIFWLGIVFILAKYNINIVAYILIGCGVLSILSGIIGTIGNLLAKHKTDDVLDTTQTISDNTFSQKKEEKNIEKDTSKTPDVLPSKDIPSSKELDDKKQHIIAKSADI